MIKSIIQVFPLHVMSCLKLPTTICSLLEKRVRKFYWGGRGGGAGNQMERKIHWINWTHLYDRKIFGGLGLKKYDLFNQSMLTKKGWNILTNPNSILARLYKAFYFPNTSFLQA